MKLLLAAVLALFAFHSAAADDVPQLGRGINLGNFLEAPQEGGWSGGRVLQESNFANIKQAGFSFVRVPIRWAAHFNYMTAGNADMPGKLAIDPAFLSRVDWVVAQAEKNGLTAILDYHNDDELMKNPDTEGTRFVSIWTQIAVHFKDAPPTILFELLNEPNGEFNKQPQKWNDLLASALTAVRASNPTRTIVVGPARWNSIGELKDLVLPDSDQHLLVTVHYYDPMQFTHQGAEWVWHDKTKYLGTRWLGTDAETKAVSDAFAKAEKWGADHHRPMYLGEFGAFSTGDMDSRARWIACVARTAEADGMSWSYWEYCSGFGAYDPKAQQWREPLLKALIP